MNKREATKILDAAHARYSAARSAADVAGGLWADAYNAHVRVAQGFGPETEIGAKARTVLRKVQREMKEEP